eukprot:365749-Chlamydomonas_euryale.AAC.13
MAATGERGTCLEWEVGGGARDGGGGVGCMGARADLQWSMHASRRVKRSGARGRGESWRYTTFTTITSTSQTHNPPCPTPLHCVPHPHAGEKGKLVGFWQHAQSRMPAHLPLPHQK